MSPPGRRQPNAADLRLGQPLLPKGQGFPDARRTRPGPHRGPRRPVARRPPAKRTSPAPPEGPTGLQFGRALRRVAEAARSTKNLQPAAAARPPRRSPRLSHAPLGRRLDEPRAGRPQRPDRGGGGVGPTAVRSWRPSAKDTATGRQGTRRRTRLKSFAGSGLGRPGGRRPAAQLTEDLSDDPVPQAGQLGVGWCGQQRPVGNGTLGAGEHAGQNLKAGTSWSGT